MDPTEPEVWHCLFLFGHVSGDGVRWVEAYFGDTPSLTYDILLTPNIDWTPGPGTTSATLVQASQMCGECDDEGCTGTYYLTDLKQATVVLPRFNPRKLRSFDQTTRTTYCSFDQENRW